MISNEAGEKWRGWIDLGRWEGMGFLGMDVWKGYGWLQCGMLREKISMEEND